MSFMATRNMRIQVRSGTESQWATGPSGVILACGELGYDTTNSVLKVGNGVDGWNTLLSISAGSGGGPTGPSGAQGLTGPQGETGAQGLTGPQGSTGAQGETGPQGSTGAQGETGPQGSTGAQGETGPQGSTGASGVQGETGPQGSTGASGVQGLTGPQGITGASGVQGLTGPQGSTGASGVQGETGPQGVTGPQGDAFQFKLQIFDGYYNPALTESQGIVYELEYYNRNAPVVYVPAIGDFIVVKYSLADSPPVPAPYNIPNIYQYGYNYRPYTGTPRWLLVGPVSYGPRGETGAQGFTGVQGPTGPSGGPRGSTGASGVQGLTGPQGVTGASGVQGLTGPQGSTGPSGSQGLTGPQGSTGASGVQGLQGATGPGVETNLINNIGINAYISYATATFTYNQSTRSIAYVVTLFGNSKYYDITFTYSGAGLPALVGTHSTSVDNTTSTIYNNKAVTPPSTNLKVNYTGTFSAVIPAGTYTITITVSTANAGGVGAGSSYVISYPISIDDIGNPTISFSDPTITQGTPVVISGITYYGTGTTISYAARALTLNNIYKVNSNYTLPNPGFNYITIASGVTLSNSTTNLEYISGGSTYADFPAGSGVNATYYNKNPIVLTLNNTNVSGNTASGSQITRVLRNAIDYTTSGNLHSTSKEIGYINAWPTPPTLEINIPIKVSPANPRTIDGITSQTRMSFPNGQANPLTPSSFTDFDNTTLTNYDPAYNPFNGTLYASDLATLLNGTYLLPSSASFSFGTKYLLIRAAASSRLRAFTLNLTGSTNIEEVYVRWEGTNWGTATWYNAKVGWQSAGGASTAYPTATSFPITININDYNYNATGGGNIYFNIKFTGTILMNQIVIT